MGVLGIHLPTLTAQIINWLILAAIVVIACVIGRDARHRGLPLSRAVGWFLLTLFLFPIGIALYLLVGRPKSPKAEDKGV
jgi:uncharacterized membrane protein